MTGMADADLSHTLALDVSDRAAARAASGSLTATGPCDPDSRVTAFASKDEIACVSTTRRSAGARMRTERPDAAREGGHQNEASHAASAARIDRLPAGSYSRDAEQTRIRS